MKAVISKVAFRQWLQSKGPGVSVGMPNNPYLCPIALFLVHDREDKETYVQVSHGRFRVGRSGTRSLPLWACRFVHKVDGNGRLAPVTAAEALAILDAVPA